MALRTEYPFHLPKGYVDGDGAVHHDGTMRLATARDELEPLSDPKVKDADDPYLSVIVLSRVITRLGPHTRLSPRDVEGLFAADLAYLQDVYATINYGTQGDIDRFLADRDRPGRAAAAPLQRTDPVGTTATAAASTSGAATPVSDAARSLVGAARTEEVAPERAPDDQPLAEVSHAPRRTRIEEVGRSSGRPR